MMETEVKNIIFGTVRDLILEQRPKKWVSISTEIFENLDKLNPSICEDGDTGKIAFGPDEKRMKIRTARFLTRKLHLNSGFLNDVQIRAIQIHIDDLLFSDIVQTYIATGRDIKRNYYDEIGGSSCMTECNSNYVGLYVDNPDVYSQLIMKRGNDSARAMIVKLDNGKYLLDRIYTDAEDLAEKMREYANNQGWFYRDHPTNILSNGERVPNLMQFIVTGLKFIDGEVPYQDTLIHGRIQGGCLDLMYSSDYEYEFEVSGTNGYINNGYECCVCGGRVFEEHPWIFGGEIYCECCVGDAVFICDHCNEAIPHDDGRHILDKDIFVCSSCAENYYNYCEECDEYFSNGNVQCINSVEKYVCNDCLSNNYIQCQTCSEYFPNDETIEGENGNICGNCREDEENEDDKECKGQLKLPFEDRTVG